MSRISFSFITDTNGIPLSLSYKDISDSVTNDVQAVTKVVKLIGEHIDVLTSPGYHKDLIARL
jgi:hypothetical protein